MSSLVQTMTVSGGVKRFDSGPPPAVLRFGVPVEVQRVHFAEESRDRAAAQIHLTESA